MNKPLISIILGISVLTSCQSNLEEPSSQVDRIAMKKIPTVNYTIPVDSALSYLSEFLNSDDSDTRTSSLKRIGSVIPIKNPTSVTRATENCIDTLIYIANFENEEGYAVLAADQRIPEKIIAITEQGNLNQQDVALASSLISQDRPVFKLYPLSGPGLYTLQEYGEETFMNPNTVSLYRDFEVEGDIEFPNSNQISSSDGTQSDLLPLTLCMTYGLNSIPSNGGDDHRPVLMRPVEDLEPGGGGSGGNSGNYTTTITSGWKTAKVSNNILRSYASWHQRSPFNDFYPERRTAILFGKKRKAPAGCFPLAIAKILTNFQQPTSFTHNGIKVNWQGLKDRDALSVDPTSAATLLAGSRSWCESWYFYQGTIIYSIPGINITKSHSWNIDGYKIKEKTITTSYYQNNELVNTSTRTETCNMVHCDYGHGGYANGYYVSGVFKLNDTDAEKDYIDDSPNDKTHYNHYIHLITYDLQ